ncbi:PREDICTED: glutathione S-transferase Mu 1-like, partial [Propithecus coquereli]|uniref:glutathione S-transferase Mu 1-like n=1 Tax=Propithecus coquereli TaxID=379532 RepID=UPI00063EE86D
AGHWPSCSCEEDGCSPVARVSRTALGRPASVPGALVSEGGDSYSLSQEKLKPEYLGGLPETLKLYSQFLGTRPWFAGDKITFVDFLTYDVLDLHRIFEPKCLDAFPNLKDFMARFEVMTPSSSSLVSLIPLPSFVTLS